MGKLNLIDTKLPKVGTTIFTVMSQLALEHGAVNLGQGFPDEDGPPAMLKVAENAIAEGINQYPPGLGIAPLREAIAAQRMRHFGTAYDPETEVLVTVGATEAIASAVLGLVEPGSEVLLIEPFYDSYSPVIAMAGCERRAVPLMQERRVPALRVVPPYYEHPAYLDAVDAVIREEQAKLAWRPDHYILSFHGIPVRYSKAGDPYATHVKRTTKALVARLGWRRGEWTQSFQSLFGREMWLKPYTDDILEQLARQGKKKVFIAMPGFTADCLETVDEIGHVVSRLVRLS